MSPGPAAGTDESLLLRAVIDHGIDAVLVCDDRGVVRWANARAAGLFGSLYVEGLHLRDLAARADRPLLAAALASCLDGPVGPAPRPVEFRCAPPAGGAPATYAEAVLTDLRDHPSVRGVVVSLHDVTERRRQVDAMAHRALHDPLTDLPNRSLFTDRLGHALRRLRRHPGSVAVLYADVDRFKEINDRLGHSQGDRVLREVAAALRRRVRPGDTVSRFGGDEFVLLCEAVDAGEALAVADRVSRPGLQLLAPAETGPGPELTVTLSVGVALASSPVTRADDLLTSADAAMYLAKERGRGRAVLFDSPVPA